MHRILIQGFKYRADPVDFFITWNAVTYRVSIDPRAGVEDVGPALLTLLLTIAPTLNPAYSVTATPTVISDGVITLHHTSYTGVAPAVTTAQDGTEQFEVRPGSLTALGLRKLAPVDGIFAARGRLGAWTYENKIHWSSVVNPLDFTPAISTQANELKVKAQLGNIIRCISTTDGFVIYSSGNIIRGSYTGGQEVFGFAPISGTGITDPRSVSAQDNTHLAWTNTGLQVLDATSNTMEPAIPELLDYIKEYTNPIKIQYLNSRYIIINLIEDPYLGISNIAILEGSVSPVNIGLNSAAESYTLDPVEFEQLDITGALYPIYKTALIYDMILKKWGLANLEYKTICSINPINKQGFNTEKGSQGQEFRLHNGLRGLAIVDATTKLALCNNNPSDCYLRLGNFRTSQGNDFTQVNSVRAEFASYANANIRVIGSLDGRLLSTINSKESIRQEHPGHVYFPLTISGVFFNILVQGKFHLTQLTVEAHNNGS